MITIITEAENIPDGYEVRKKGADRHSGNKYTLQRKLKIYAEKDLAATLPQEIKSEGIIFLVGEGHINAYPESKELALDFKDEQDAIEFLQIAADNKEDK